MNTRDKQLRMRAIRRLSVYGVKAAPDFKKMDDMAFKLTRDLTQIHNDCQAIKTMAKGISPTNGKSKRTLEQLNEAFTKFEPLMEHTRSIASFIETYVAALNIQSVEDTGV